MIFVGIDVSKANLDCALESSGKAPRSKRFPNTQAGLVALLEWAGKQALCSAAELHFVMEATGVYHEAAAHFLYEQGATVSIANPHRVREFAKGLAFRNKTDAQDRVVLLRFGQLTHPRAWQPAPLEVRQLRALIAHLAAVEADLQRNRNRLEKAEIASAPEPVRRSLTQVIDMLNQETAKLKRVIHEHIDHHPGLKQDQKLLESIPAIGEKNAWQLLSLLRSHHFLSAAQAAAFVGLVPVEHQSGSSVWKRPHLAKTGSAKLRASLYMAAVSAIRCNPDVKALYLRLVQAGKCKMAALGAAMRKLIHISFGVLKHQVPYAPQGVPA